jgi:hypothetical protein
MQGPHPSFTLTDSDDTNGGGIFYNNGALSVAADTGNTGATGLISFQIDGTEDVTIDGGGDLTLKTGDIVFGTSGKGICLGATSATAANTLQDYEEGTYTVAMTAGSSGTITLNGSYNTGTYTKVGRLVHVAADVRISSVSSPNGVLFISLPFTALNNGLAVSSNSILTAGVTEQTSQDGPFFVRSLANTTTAEVFYDTNASMFTLQAQNGGLGSNDQFSFTLTYMAE